MAVPAVLVEQVARVEQVVRVVEQVARAVEQVAQEVEQAVRVEQVVDTAAVRVRRTGVPQVVLQH